MALGPRLVASPTSGSYPCLVPSNERGTLAPCGVGAMRNDFIHMLRGLAAFSVVAFHICKHSESPSPALAAVRVVTSYGWLGVPVFFVISGFVIANSLRAAWVTPRYAGRYVLRRIARLDPPYWTMIGVALLYRFAISKVTGEPTNWPGWESFFAHLIYLQHVLGYNDISVGFWTLCLEVQFYLSMLVLVAMSQRAHALLPLVVSILGAGTLLLSADIHYPATSAWADAYRSLIPNFPMFAVGIMAWMYATGRIGNAWWLAVTIACAVRLAWWFEVEILTAIVVGNAIVMNARGKLPIPRFAPLMMLGTISYSLYLSHPIASRAVQLGVRKFTGFDGDASLLMCTAVILFCLPVGWLMYLVVERPSMRWSESLKEKREEPISSGHAAKDDLPETVPVEAS